MNWTTAALILVPLAISAGQLLFKIASRTAGELSISSILALFANPWFLSALVLYATATIAWVFVLRHVPVGRAYLFMSLSFIAVPFAAWAVLGEIPDVRQMVGVLVITAGIAISSS
ncbi:MAG: transporter [Panacagrimonas sp.]